MRTIRPKLGVFSKFMKFNKIGCFITQLVKKLQQWSLCEMIEDVLSFVLNTKRPQNIVFFSENTQNCFAHNSATKYRSEGVLYAKRRAGHPLSSHIKTIVIAFLQAITRYIGNMDAIFWKIGKKHPI